MANDPLANIAGTSPAFNTLGTDQPQQSVLPDQVVDRTARMATLALNPLSEIQSQYDELTQNYQQTIRQYGDINIRQQAALAQQRDEIGALSKVANSDPMIDPTGELRIGSSLAIQQKLATDMDETARYALEQRAYDTIQTMRASDPTQASIMASNLANGDAEQVLHDLNVKKVILNNLVEQAGVDNDNLPWFRHLTDFVVSMTGDLTNATARGRAGIVDVDEAGKHWWDFLMSGTRQRNEAATLWSQDPATFAKTVKEQVIPRVKDHATSFGYYNHTTALNLLSGLANTPDPTTTNIGDATNVAMLATMLPVGKMAQISSLMLRSGARAQAAETLAATTLDAVNRGVSAASKASGIGEEELIHNLEPGAIRTADPISTVPLTGDVLGGLDRGYALMGRIRELMQASRMSPGEFQNAIQKEQARITEEIGRPLKDFTLQREQLVDGSEIYQFQMDVGKKRGGGFATKSSASNQAKAFGYQDSEIVQDESGQYFIRIKRNMNEASYYTNELNVGLNKTGFIGRVVLGARQVGDEAIQGLDRQAANVKQAIQSAMRDNFHKRLTSISYSQRADLAQIMSWGEENGVWLDKDQFEVLYQRAHNRAPTAKEFDAYNAARDINDIEFALRNDDLYKNKAIKGFETVSFDHPMVKVDRQNALIGRGNVERPNGRIFDIETGIHYHENNPLTPERFKEKIDDGYILVRLENEHRMADNTTVKNFLMKESNAKTELLRRDQMPYRAGGHRMYVDKYFVKQAEESVQPDTGRRFLKNPNTFVSGTKAEMETWATTMEHARQLYQAKAAPELIDEVLSTIPEMDHQKFDALIKSGQMNADHEIQAVFDRELPSIYTKGQYDLDFVDLEADGFTGWARSNGRMYYSSKGDVLHDWTGAQARVLDPFDSTNAALSNIANISSFSNYKISAVERWVKTFEPYLDTKSYPSDASALTKFTQGQMRPDVLKQPLHSGHLIKQQMEAQRDIIKRNIGWRTELDRQMEMYGQRMADWIMGDDPRSFRHAAAGNMIKWWNDTKPINMIRGLAFDLKMGLFNPAQFPLQIQTMVSTLALVGAEHAPAILTNNWFLRRYLMKTGNEELLDLAIQRGMHTMHGMEPEEYKVMMRLAKRSGFFDRIDQAHQLVNSYGPNAAVGGIKDGVDSFRRAGRWFFNEGETWNRVTAWQAAWKDVMKSYKWPEKLGNEAAQNQVLQDLMGKVALRADDYSMSMMTQASAMWQHGLMSIPTQFWAYNARTMEALLGKQFTPQQKLRLFLAQFLFYGAAGVPVVGAIASAGNRLAGKAPQIGSPDPLEATLAAIERGGLDEIIYHTTGADVLMGKRYGTGSWSTDLAAELMGMSPYGEKSFMDVVGGATWSIFKDTSSTLGDVIKHTVAESGAQDYPITKEDLKRLAMNASTLSYGYKAMMILKYNAMVSNTGTVSATDLPTQDAWFAMLGVSPSQQDLIAARVGWLKDRKKAVDEATKFITDHRTRMQVEVDNRDEIAAEMNAMARLTPKDIWTEALIKANQHKSSKALNESLGQQIQRDMNQKKALNNVQPN